MKASQMLYGLLLLCALLVAVIAVRLPDGKIWFDAFQPLSTVIIGVAAISLAYQNYALAQKKRQDDLFKLRWEFYIKIWLEYVERNRGNVFPTDLSGKTYRHEYDDGFSWDKYAEEASFLFSPTVGREVANFADRPAYGAGGLEDPDIEGLSTPRPKWFRDIFHPFLKIAP